MTGTPLTLSPLNVVASAQGSAAKERIVGSFIVFLEDVNVLMKERKEVMKLESGVREEVKKLLSAGKERNKTRRHDKQVDVGLFGHKTLLIIP
jgi:hypothetical protein